MLGIFDKMTVISLKKRLINTSSSIRIKKLGWRFLNWNEIQELFNSDSNLWIVSHKILLHIYIYQEFLNMLKKFQIL